MVVCWNCKLKMENQTTNKQIHVLNDFQLTKLLNFSNGKSVIIIVYLNEKFNWIKNCFPHKNFHGIQLFPKWLILLLIDQFKLSCFQIILYQVSIVIQEYIRSERELHHLCNISKHINRLSVNIETKNHFIFVFCRLLLCWVEKFNFEKLGKHVSLFLIPYCFLFNKKHILQLISVFWTWNAILLQKQKENILRISCT